MTGDRDRIVEGTDLTVDELAVAYGVDAWYIDAATDPDEERRAERRDLAAIYGVQAKYIDLDVFEHIQENQGVKVE